MIEIGAGAGAVVADDVRSSVRALDEAILTVVRTCASFIEATDGAGVPAALSQATLRSMACGMASAVDARGGMVDAIRQMLVIKRRSTVAWMDYGCPTGLDGEPPRSVQPQRVGAETV